MDLLDSNYVQAKVIALFTVTFAYLHYNLFERGCEAISGSFAVSARNCLTFTFKYVVMQMRKVNCEKGYFIQPFKSNALLLVTGNFRPVKSIRVYLLLQAIAAELWKQYSEVFWS